jgi:predicted NBD/HSP70 family sugar kinase
VLGSSADRHPIELRDLVGGPAIRALAREHGIAARTAAQAVAKVCTANDPSSEAFIDELASRLASGLAVITQVLDPHVIVLSGDVCAAGGQQLARRVKRELRRISKLRPSLMVSGVEGNPALVGALELSLHHTRDALFRASAEALVGNVR